MRKKQFYEAPEAELLVVKVEENFLQSGPYGGKNAAGTDLTEEDGYTYSY